MFSFADCLRAALEAISVHGLRSFLTTLGIAIGVASVVAVIALVQGMQASIVAEFEGLGGNSLTVASFTTVEAAMQGRPARLTPDDMELIAARVDGIASITPLLYSPALAAAELRHGASTAFAPVRGVTHAYPRVYNAYAEVGRFLSVADDRRRRRVCVIGDKTREDLGLPDNPVGAHIALGGEWLKVVGVMERRGELLGMSQDEYVLVPYSTMRSLIGPGADADMVIQLALAPGADRDAATVRISRLLRDAHGLAPGEDDDFRIQTPDQISEAFEQIGATVTAVVGGIVGISLLVGGIGIMNIMLVSVTERTRQIGILKALGATRGQILAQFLAEALALSLFGGLLGLAAGYGLGAAVAAAVPDLPSVVVPAWAIALALGFSALIGVAFGMLPAHRAANLDPIEALRYE